MVKRDMCNDKDIIKQVCKDICSDNTRKDECNDCVNNIKFMKNNQNRIWRDVQKYGETCTSIDYTCKNSGMKCIHNPSDKDPDILKCGFTTVNDYGGNCIITSEKTCKNLSKPYFICSNTAESLGDCDVDKNGDRYCEWHSEGTDGKCIYGNFLSKQWAEYPKTHSDVKHSGGTPPPFFYDQDNSNIY